MGCAVMAGGQSPSPVAPETASTAKVPSSCAADPVVSASALHGETPAGVVSLTGFVDRAEAQRRAIP
jgi:osmotically-inducible protein OsmY